MNADVMVLGYTKRGFFVKTKDGKVLKCAGKAAAISKAKELDGIACQFLEQVKPIGRIRRHWPLDTRPHRAVRATATSSSSQETPSPERQNQEETEALK